MLKTKRTLLIFFFLLSTCISVYAQGQQKFEESYVVIKAFLQTVTQPYILDVKLNTKPTVSSVNFENVLSRTMYDHSPYLESNIDSLLRTEDFQYMKSQLAAAQQFIKLDSDLLQKHKVILNSHAAFKSELTLRLSFPLLSVKGDVALLYVEHDRGKGIRGGRVVFLKKDSNGSWQLVSSVPIWMT